MNPPHNLFPLLIVKTQRCLDKHFMGQAVNSTSFFLTKNVIDSFILERVVDKRTLFAHCLASCMMKGSLYGVGGFSVKVFLKVYGERNSGTTFIEKLLALNLPVKVLPGGVPKLLYRGLPYELFRDSWFFWTESRNLGWKHGIPVPGLIRNFMAKHRLIVVAICKNPYAWLLSFYRHPYHLVKKWGSFSAFLEAQCNVVRRENAKGLFQNPVELWNVKNRALLELSKSKLPVILLRYEDVLAAPEIAVENVASISKLKMNDAFQGVYFSTKREDNRHFEEYRSYYLDEKWRTNLSEENVRRINRDLDHKLCGELGYELINPKISEGKDFY